MNAARALLCAPLLAATATAQTFVVNSAGGAGTHFTNLAVAVNTVPDGSTLLVQPGFYGEFHVQAKSLRILGSAGAVVNHTATQPGSSISQIGANQQVVVQKLQFARAANAPVRLFVGQSAGPVLLDEVVPAQSPLTIAITDAQHVQVRSTPLSPPGAAVDAINSNVVVIGGSLGPTTIGGFTANGLRMTGGTVQIADCAVRGAVLFSGFGIPAGIAMQGGDLRLLGLTTITGGVSATPSAAPAISGTGTVRATPSVVFATAAPVAWPAGVVLTTAPMLHLTANRSGAFVSTIVRGTAGELAAIAMSLPAGPVALPGVADAVWLDAATLTFPGVGILSPNLAVPVPIPAGLLAGTRATFQAVSFDASGALQFSNPTFVLLP